MQNAPALFRNDVISSRQRQPDQLTKPIISQQPDFNKKNFFPRTCCAVHKKHDKREPGLFKEEFRCTEMLALCSKTFCCSDSESNKFKLSSKGLNKRTLENTGDGPMSKYRRVLDEAVNLKSTNCGFKTSNHLVATYEQTKKTQLLLPEKRIT